MEALTFSLGSPVSYWELDEMYRQARRKTTVVLLPKHSSSISSNSGKKKQYLRHNLLLTTIRQMGKKRSMCSDLNKPNIST
jgi:hypothetical protein